MLIFTTFKGCFYVLYDVNGIYVIIVFKLYKEKMLTDRTQSRY